MLKRYKTGSSFIKQLLLALLFFLASYTHTNGDALMTSIPAIALPEPDRVGELSIEAALNQRRSVRSYGSQPLTFEEISQLAWAAQGITDAQRGFRTAPSAGGTFPIEVYLLITAQDKVDDGVYHYLPEEHALEKKTEGDFRAELREAALGQPSITDASLVIVITGVTARTAQRYGERAERYVYMEAGHVAQNIYLQGIALEIGTVSMGAFDDERVSTLLRLSKGEQPLYIMPVGKE